jgi:hypothetical protein
MTNRFNSGASGYTCDLCHTLLWWGCLREDDKAKRNFYPKHTEENITYAGDDILCFKCSKEVSVDEHSSYGDS